MSRVRSKHNNLLNYFIHDKQDLSPAYVRNCKKFLKEISAKLQASSTKLQAPRPDNLRLKKKKKRFDIPHSPWYKVIMSRSLKPEFQPGGAKRQYILDKAVEYILDPKMGTQNHKHSFLLEEVGLSSTEYLECLNRATNGGVVKAAIGDIPIHELD